MKVRWARTIVAVRTVDRDTLNSFDLAKIASPQKVQFSRPGPLHSGTPPNAKAVSLSAFLAVRLNVLVLGRIGLFTKISRLIALRTLTNAKAVSLAAVGGVSRPFLA